MIDIQPLKSEVEELAQKYDLSLVVLFGSQATGRTHLKSDVDLGFLSDKRLSLREQAELEFGLMRASHIPNIELTDLGTVPPLLLKHIAQNGRLIYEREVRSFSLFKVYALKRYMEVKPLLRLRESSLRSFLYAR